MVEVGRREKKKVATREQIVEAAARLFAARDYDAVTVDEIAEEADVVKGTFYNHFDTKEDVAAAVSHSRTEGELRKLETMIDGGKPAIEVLRSMFATIACWASENRRLVHAVTSHALCQPASAGMHSAKEKPLIVLLNRALTHGQATGEIRTDLSPDEMARMFSVLLFNAIWTWADDPTSQPLDESLTRCLALCLGGVASPTQTPSPAFPGTAAPGGRVY